MLFYTVGQSQVFIAMLYAGFIIGAWYDVTRAVRRILSAGLVLSIACDLTFGAGAAALLIAFLLKANYFDLRFYTLLGALCGFALYVLSIGPLLSAIGRFLSKWLGKFSKLLHNAALFKIIFK